MDTRLTRPARAELALVETLDRMESKSVPCDTAPRRNRALVAGQIRWQRFGRKCFNSWSRTRTRLRASSWRSSKLDIRIDTALAICVPCSGGSGSGGSRRVQRLICDMEEMTADLGYHRGSVQLKARL